MRQLVRLQTKRGKDFGDQQECHIDWSIDYNGPRKPFTVLQPSFTISSSGQTKLFVYYPQHDGSGSETFVQSPFASGRWSAVGSAFITSKGDGSVAGTIAIPMGENFHSERSDHPPILRKFPRGTTIYLQLHHQPTERGWIDSVDAWTGLLWSEPVALIIGD